MNQRFFDLKKDKQDRIINTVIRHLGLHGFSRTSTDEIVREAGISKGLLFHYFENKQGMFIFAYDFGARYLILELQSQIREPSADFFALQRQLLEAEVMVMRKYPCLFLFLERAQTEEVPELRAAVQEKAGAIRSLEEHLHAALSGPSVLMSSSPETLEALLRARKLSLVRRGALAGSLSVDGYRTEIAAAIDALESLMRPVTAAAPEA